MLNYRIHGTLQPGERPLVVMHGLLGSLDNWNTFASRQQDQRTVIALDLRNHGDSPHVDGMGYQLMSDDVIEVLDALHLPQVDLMGHSMGGKVAMWLALQHPERVHRLIVVDIAPVNYPPRHQALLQAMLTMPLASFSKRREADDWLAPTVKQPFERAFLLKNLKWNEHSKLVWQCNLPEIGRHYLKLTAFPDSQLRYTGHALFIGGGQSDYLDEPHWQAAQAQFPGARRVMIAEAGHLPHVQTPDAFVEQVRAGLE
ncbi:MAG: alpha/beta fold hydrolase [Thiolinea sp.]